MIYLLTDKPVFMFYIILHVHAFFAKTMLVPFNSGAVQNYYHFHLGPVHNYHHFHI